YINTPSWDRPTICYNDDDDEDYTIAITPILSTEEPDNSLSMGDEHLDTIPATESDEFIKSSIENLVPIPSESEGIPDNMCDVSFHDNSPPLDISKDQFKDFSDSNDDSTSIDDDSFSIDNIEYVESSPPDSELVSSEVMEIVIPEVGGIDDDIILTIKDDILQISSSSTTTRSDISLPDDELSMTIMLKRLVVAVPLLILIVLFMIRSSLIFRSTHFLLPIGVIFMSSPMNSLTSYLHRSMIVSPLRMNPTRGDFTIDVVGDIFPTREPRVHVHNALPTHPTLQLNLDFILSSESLFACVVWIFLHFLSYSVAPQYLLFFRNEDTIFDPDISSYHIPSFMPDVSHRSETFIKINVHPKHLNGSPIDILFSTFSPMDQ
nr:hypothetical protein [Tanacetum cinerariifolium]